MKKIFTWSEDFRNVLRRFCALPSDSTFISAGKIWFNAPSQVSTRLRYHNGVFFIVISQNLDQSVNGEILNTFIYRMSSPLFPYSRVRQKRQASLSCNISSTWTSLSGVVSTWSSLTILESRAHIPLIHLLTVPTHCTLLVTQLVLNSSQEQSCPL